MCLIAIVFTLRSLADVVDKKDFSLAKEEQMEKARRLLGKDSIDAAAVLLNMVVSDVEAKKKITPTEAEAIADAWLELGSIHSSNRKEYAKYYDYGKSYASYRKAAAISREFGLKSREAKALCGLAGKYEVQLSSYPEKELTDTLLQILKRSVALARESKSWEIQDNAMKILASEAFSHGRGEDIRKEIDDYYNTPLKEDNENHGREYNVAFIRAMQALSENDIPGALGHTKTMESYAAGNPSRKVDTYSMRAEILYNQKRMAEVEVCMDSVSKAAAEIGDPWIDMQVERSKSVLYKAMGKKALSDSCLFRYYELRERLFEDRSANRIKDLHFLDRIDSVTLEMQKITLERQHARTLLYIAIGVLLIFGFMLVLLIRTNRNLRESKKRIFEEYSRKLKEEELLEGAESLKPTPAAEEPTEETGKEEDEKYKSSQLTEQQKKDVLHKIKTALANSEAALSSRYQIKDLANEAGESTRNISQVINEKCGCNFATFLAEHRIKTACRRITESAAYRKLTIEAMATSVGIQSRSYFSTTFKKIVGLNPSDYIRQAEKGAENK